MQVNKTIKEFMYSSHKTRSLVPCLLLIGVTILIGCLPGEAETEMSGNLRPVQSFGDDGEGFIAGSMYFTSDRQSNIYVSDWQRSQILQFTLEGDYIQAHGNAGQGPGEFGAPMDVDAVGDHFLVLDFGNTRISHFTSTGELQQIMQLDYSPFPVFGVSSEWILTGGPVSFLQNSGLESEDLFHLYNYEGDKIRSFGEFRTNQANMPAVMSRSYIKFHEDQIHVGYMYFPLYEIYNLEGEQIASFNLDEITTMEGAAQNHREETFTDPTSSDVTAVIRGIDVVNDRVFVQRFNNENLHIDEFELDGVNLQFKTSHFFSGSGTREVVGIWDFFFIPGRNSFYVLEIAVEGNYRITEYELTES